MILPVQLNNVSVSYNNATRIQKRQTSTNAGSDNLKLSGCNNPMKSYVSFGWCTAHYQAMYDIDVKFDEKIRTRLMAMENLKEYKKKRYSIADAAALEAAKIIAQYANMQCVIAEVPPSYAVMNGGKLKQAMNESKTLTNPVSSLIAINALVNMDVKNNKLDNKHLERAKGSTQLYAIAILLNQVEENKNKPEFIQNREFIDELSGVVKDSLCKIYGKDIFERIEEFGNMGKKPTDEQKAQALDFLVEVDSVAETLVLPEDFEEKLQILLDKQSDDENRTMGADSSKNNKFAIKVQYPDHEHSVAHAHGIPHTHDHDHVHVHDSKYKEILDNIRSQKTIEQQIEQNEQEKKKTIIGE